MPAFICPVCGGPLKKSDRTMACPTGHSFDIARQGYVNLILSSRSSDKRRGDDKRMVSARQRFLDRGYYAPLRDTVVQATMESVPARADILDVGCGECYYTAAVQMELCTAGIQADIAGVDISKTALMAGAGRRREIHLAVASAASLPVGEASCDLVMNIFAPCVEGEFHRVLRPGGTLLRVIPLERHLFALKAAVYAQPYENTLPALSLAGFQLAETRDLLYSMEVAPGQDIQDLFQMTPYYYKTSALDQAKLLTLDTLQAEAAFRICIYRRDGQ